MRKDASKDCLASGLTFSQARQYIQDNLTALYTSSEICLITKLLVEKIAQNTYLEMLMYPQNSFQNSSLLYDYIATLKKNKPLQYVLGECYFCGYHFKVNEYTLIPRPETAMLVEKITQLSQQIQATHLLDIGTGSGCIAISAKIQNPYLKVEALEICPEALAVAEENATELHQKIYFMVADIFKYTISSNQYDMIVSNPPYVSHQDKNIMQSQVVDFEPHIALFVPADNMLLYYKRLVEVAYIGLKQPGFLIVEIEKTMGKDV
ncbi:MAG: N5-glutamine methyltransferase family protein, partial [Chitinophagaceae bacterium]